MKKKILKAIKQDKNFMLTGKKVVCIKTNNKFSFKFLKEAKTIEDVYALFDGVKTCTSCTNCINCTGCEDCKYCGTCKSCKRCTHCEDCKTCKNCKYCEGGDGLECDDINIVGVFDED